MVDHFSVERDRQQIAVALGHDPSQAVMDLYVRVQKTAEKLNGNGFLTAQTKAVLLVLAEALCGEADVKPEAPEEAAPAPPVRRGPGRPRKELVTADA